MFGPEWPQQRIQVLRNRVVDEWAGREDQIPNPPPAPAIIGHTTMMPWSIPNSVPYDMPKFSAMLPTPAATGDFEEMCMAAGEGVSRDQKHQTGAGDRERHDGGRTHHAGIDSSVNHVYGY